MKVARPTLFGYIETREEFEYYTNELFSLLKSGQLKTKIHKIYPMEDIIQVHKVRGVFVHFLITLTVKPISQDLEGRKTMGKPLLRP